MNAYLKRYLITLLFAAGICILLLGGSQAKAADKENCLMCHKHRFIGRIDENGRKWNYNVDEAIYNRSVHRIVECRNCHTTITKIPHDPVTQQVNCANLCHIKPPFAQKKFSHKKIIDLFNESAHGIRPQDPEDLKSAKPDCKFCHLNPLYAKISEKRVPYGKTLGRCYNCHLPRGVTQAYRHITHRLRKKTSRSPGQIVKLCSKCHQNAELMKKGKVSQKTLAAVKTYNQSIHGKLVRLGSQKAADCVSCHASSALHDIYKKENKKATIAKDNLAKTCRQCHKKTNSWFIRIAVHPDAKSEDSRAIGLVSIFLRSALYGVVFSLLGLLLAETFGRRKEGLKLLLRDGTSWRGKSKPGSPKQKGTAGRPEKSARLNHPLASYLIGSVFMVLTWVVFTGVVYHLTLSDRGPGLLRPLLEKYSQQHKSEILDEARHLEELEQHRHFHNIAADHPRLPENRRPACFICHSDYPHGKNKKIRGLMNIHTQFFVCETCHIREKPGTTIVYKWYNPLDDNPRGPFYGTSYDPATGYLSKGKDQISRISPYVKSLKTAGLELAIKVQDAPLARDYMKVRDKLSPEQREGIKNKFHEDIKPRGRDCKRCHTKNGILDFKQLGFTENRISNLMALDIIGMLEKYEEFYMPELFTEKAFRGDEKEKGETPKTK